VSVLDELRGSKLAQLFVVGAACYREAKWAALAWMFITRAPLMTADHEAELDRLAELLGREGTAELAERQPEQRELVAGVLATMAERIGVEDGEALVEQLLGGDNHG
jgi:hypothetical protein